MAIRTKTVEFPFPANTVAVTAGARYDFSAITVKIPENSSRTFHSVDIESIARVATSSGSGGQTMTKHVIGVKLGTTGFSDWTIPSYTNGGIGEHTMQFNREFASYFNAYWGATRTENTFQIGLIYSGTGCLMVDEAAKATITYSYDDSSQTTRVKTVKFPLQSTLTRLSTNVSTIDIVPHLDAELPEESKEYQHIWFELESNEYISNVSTAGAGLLLKLDSETEATFSTRSSKLRMAGWDRRIWVRNDMTTNASHTFYARISTGGGSGNERLLHFGGFLGVTYTYDHENSSTIMNSLELPAGIGNNFMTRTDSRTMSLCETLNIQEPGTIALKRSGAQVTFISRDKVLPGKLEVWAGAQTPQNYTMPHDSFSCRDGNACITHRLDSASLGGVGLSLTRGDNLISINFKSTRSSEGSTNGWFLPTLWWGSVFYINYHSGKHSLGDGVHNATRKYVACDSNQTTGLSGVDLQMLGARQSPPLTPAFSETDYRISNVGFVHRSGFYQSYGGDIHLSFVASTASAYAGAGVSIASAYGYSDVFFNQSKGWGSLTRFFAKDSFGFDTYRVSIKSPFYIQWYDAVGGLRHVNSAYYLTYHSIVQTVGGTISGLSGAGTGLGVFVHSVGTTTTFVSSAGELVGYATSNAGTYVAKTFETSAVKFAHTREDATHVGRSDEGTE